MKTAKAEAEDTPRYYYIYVWENDIPRVITSYGQVFLENLLSSKIFTRNRILKFFLENCKKKKWKNLNKCHEKNFIQKTFIRNIKFF
jgi:hypothetical protein